MKNPTGLPLALYHANAALQARIGSLIQDGGQHWLDFSQRLINDGLVESGAELQELMRSQDWQALASLPAEAFWRQLQQRFGDQQAATQIMVAAHTAFARGLQDAVQDWQRETVEALDAAGLGLPAGDPDWSRLFSAWEPLLAGIMPTAAPLRATAGATATRGPTAARAPSPPAPKKAAAARKPAAKKAAASARPVAKKTGASRKPSR